MRTEARPHLAPRGFTLVELVIVIVLGAIVAAMLTSFMRPAFDAWLASRSRAELAAEAAQALRHMQREVRTAVPNSIRTPGSQCFEMVPTIAGGRLRLGPDTARDVAPGCSPAADCAAPFDPTQTVSVFDVLTPLQQEPAAGDLVVVDNQNPGDVYSGANRAAIVSVASPPAATQGSHRVTIAATGFPQGHTSGRLLVVPAAQQAVFYSCTGADGTLDADGNGRGTLLRRHGYGFDATYPTSCPTTGNVLARRVVSCRFVYDPNLGATQQHGFVSMQIELAVGGERASLVLGAHVRNVP
ncbi:MAG: prepilin-type N-terminal cleavage/methylation domain-containing protein [Rubrivivax sp.]